MINKTHEMHVPVEQYGFISLTIDGATTEQAVAAYREISDAVKVQPVGLPKKEFEEIIDLMIEREPIQQDPGILEGMNPAQKYILDFVRKSIGRIDYKNR